MNEWKVSVTYVRFEKLYQVYRLRDPDDVDHSGNREVVGTFDDEARAEEFAAELNQRDGS